MKETNQSKGEVVVVVGVVEGVVVGGIKGGGFNPCKRVQAACKQRGFGCWCDIATVGKRLPAGEEIVPNCS